jgi:hypothetical protein
MFLFVSFSYSDTLVLLADRLFCHKDGKRVRVSKIVFFFFFYLTSCILSSSSRISDHPLLLGNSAPRLSDLDRCNRWELLTYGRRRHASCNSLADRAVQKCDQLGTFRIATIESISVCAFELFAYLTCETLPLRHRATVRRSFY